LNDRVEFEVLEDITLADTLVIPKGGITWETVTEAQPKRRMERGGKLKIVMDAVRLMDGEKAAVAKLAFQKFARFFAFIKELVRRDFKTRANFSSVSTAGIVCLCSTRARSSETDLASSQCRLAKASFLHQTHAIDNL
jgi:hypothetical protein